MKRVVVILFVLLLAGVCVAGERPTPHQVRMWFATQELVGSRVNVLPNNTCALVLPVDPPEIGMTVQYMLDPDWDPWAAIVAVVLPNDDGQHRVDLWVFPWDESFGQPYVIKGVKAQDQPHQGGIWRPVS